MKIKKEKWDTLDGVLDKIWLMLEQGAAHSDDPFHWPVLGTTAKEGCSLRTVILRKVNVPERILVCHTDARSAKVQEIMKSSQTSWIFYHPKKKIQVRISGLPKEMCNNFKRVPKIRLRHDMRPAIQTQLKL
jgi:pyridoxine/pyridoxamine 5'-phosphate oxidase